MSGQDVRGCGAELERDSTHVVRHLVCVRAHGHDGAHRSRGYTSWVDVEPVLDPEAWERAVVRDPNVEHLHVWQEGVQLDLGPVVPGTGQERHAVGARCWCGVEVLGQRGQGVRLNAQLVRAGRAIALAMHQAMQQVAEVQSRWQQELEDRAAAAQRQRYLEDLARLAAQQGVTQVQVSQAYVVQGVDVEQAMRAEVAAQVARAAQRTDGGRR